MEHPPATSGGALGFDAAHRSQGIYPHPHTHTHTGTGSGSGSSGWVGAIDARERTRDGRAIARLAIDCIFGSGGRERFAVALGKHLR